MSCTRRTSPRRVIYRVAQCSLAFLFAFHFLNLLKPRHESLVARLIAERESHSAPSRHLRHIVSVCMLVRDSSTLLPEFLVRNYLAGVDHFYIYGDDSDPEELARLQRLAALFRALVTYLPNGRGAPSDEEDPASYVQMRVYRHCLSAFGGRTLWMGFIDADEFFESDDADLLSARGGLHAGRYAFLHAVLAHYTRFPVLCVRWRTALTNGRVAGPALGVGIADAFPRACAAGANSSAHLALRKSLVQPRHVSLADTPRLDVALHKGFRLRPPRQHFHCVWGLGAAVAPPLHLAHYWSRSVAEYMQKALRGRPRAAVPPRALADLLAREAACRPDPRPPVAQARADYVRTYAPLLHLFPNRPLAIPALEQFLERAPATDDARLCLDRVRLLLYRIAAGYTLSAQRYCEQAWDSPACAPGDVPDGRAPRPYPWMEFIQSCEPKLEEDKLFVKV